MESLKGCSDAKEKYFSQLKLRSVPVISWEFKDNFQLEMKRSILDLSKLQELSRQSKWEKKNWNLVRIL